MVLLAAIHVLEKVNNILYAYEVYSSKQHENPWSRFDNRCDNPRTLDNNPCAQWTNFRVYEIIYT